MQIKIRYKLKSIRQSKHITLTELSDQSGISRSQINDIENNLKHPTIYTLCCIAAALDIDMRYLFDYHVKK